MNQSTKQRKALRAGNLLVSNPPRGPGSTGICWGLNPDHNTYDYTDNFAHFFDRTDVNNFWWPHNNSPEGAAVRDERLFALAMWAVIPEADLV